MGKSGMMEPLPIQHREAASPSPWPPMSFEDMIGEILRQHVGLRNDNLRLEQELRRARGSTPEKSGSGGRSGRPPIPKFPQVWGCEKPEQHPHILKIEDSSDTSPNTSGQLRCTAEGECLPLKPHLHEGRQQPQHHNNHNQQNLQQPQQQNSRVSFSGPFSTKECSRAEVPGMVDESPRHPVPSFRGRQAQYDLSYPDSTGMITNRSKAAFRAFGSRTQLDLFSAEQKRLRNLLEVDESSAECVTVRDVYHFLRTRIDDDYLSIELVTRALDELKAIQVQFPEVPSLHEVIPGDAIEISVLAYFVNRPHLLSVADPTVLEDVKIVTNGFRMVSMEEIIDECTRGQKVVVHGVAEQDHAESGFWAKWEKKINTVVVAAVALNLVSMGIQVDRDPSHIGWLILESACVGIYIAELILKFVFVGPKLYFTGEADWTWNCIDFLVTMSSAFEMILEVATRLDPSLGGSTSDKAASMAQVTILLRVLRVVRVVRMVKLVRSPMLSDLANMLSGFIIGLPALLWVMLFFVFILYMVGLMFRLAFGPAEDQHLELSCGAADDITNLDDPLCPVHYIYGEEFFGTVSRSMFTTFRFMLGDYSTRGGKSLVVAFSVGYGAMFETLFVGWMIIVIFGLFNIITAIFVDSTISGLKHNDIKRKYARQYERRYVQSKLREILDRIRVLYENLLTDTKLNVKYMMYEDGQQPWMKVWNTDSVHLGVEEFVHIMSDPIIQELMLDIDIEFANPAALFDTFDPEQRKTVTMGNIVQGCLKLRGEPQKNDIIASWVSLKALHEKFDKLQRSVNTEKRLPGGSRQQLVVGMPSGDATPSLSNS